MRQLDRGSLSEANEFGPAAIPNSVPEALRSAALDHFLGRVVTRGGLEVEYPDGLRKVYGDSEPELTVIFNEQPNIARIARTGALEIGEAYFEGRLDFRHPADPDALPPIDKIVKLMELNGAFDFDRRYGRYFDWLRSRRTPSDAAFHYDIGNEFYATFLDPNLTYSCAYWERGREGMSLEEAQEAKIDHIFRKLRLEPGMSLLDIGSGWGHLLIKAAKEYGVRGLGITVSQEQQQAAGALADREGVADLVKFEVMDYEDLAERAEFKDEANRFDRVVSVGMFEHVGRDEQRHYFNAVDRMLKQGGLTLLHAIGHEREGRPSNLFTNKHVFPGGQLRSLGGILVAAEGRQFRFQDAENLKEHYAWTLDAWRERFWHNIDRVEELFVEGEIKHRIIKEFNQFARMWDFYLATAAGGFLSGQLDLFQVVWSKGHDPSKQATRADLYAHLNKTD